MLLLFSPFFSFFFFNFNVKLQSGKGDILVENLQAEPVPDTGNGGIWHLQSGNRLKRNIILGMLCWLSVDCN
jgi:hypothetical protein